MSSSFKYSFLLVLFLVNCTKNKLDCNKESPTKHEKVIFLVLGQSNAANYGKKILNTDCDRLKNFYDGDLFPLNDPLKGADGTAGSVWTRLGALLIENDFAEEIIFAPVAAGGVPVNQFLPDSSLYLSMLNTINKLQLDNHEITHILWHQGESNNTQLNTSLSAQENAELYKNQFLELTHQIRSLEVNAPIFVSTATRCGFLGIDIDLQQVQQTLKSDSLQIFNGPNTDLLGNEYRYDNCHLNNKGLIKHAEAWLSILKKH